MRVKGTFPSKWIIAGKFKDMFFKTRSLTYYQMLSVNTCVWCIYCMRYLCTCRVASSINVRKSGTALPEKDIFPGQSKKKYMAFRCWYMTKRVTWKMSRIATVRRWQNGISAMGFRYRSKCFRANFLANEWRRNEKVRYNIARCSISHAVRNRGSAAHVSSVRVFVFAWILAVFLGIRRYCSSCTTVRQI